MYEAPPEKEKWRAFRAIPELPISKNDMKVLRCLVDHACPDDGQCNPGMTRIARMCNLPMRTAKRSVARLLETPYLSRRKRPYKSNAYGIHWGSILAEDDAYKARAVRLHEEHEMTLGSGTSGTIGGGTSGTVKLKVKTKSENKIPEGRTSRSEGPPDVFPPEEPSEEIDELAPTEGLAGEMIGSMIRTLSAEPEGLSKAEKAAAWLENMAPRLDGWVGEAAALLPQLERKWRAAGGMDSDLDVQTLEYWSQFLELVVDGGECGHPDYGRARRLSDEVSWAISDVSG